MWRARRSPEKLALGRQFVLQQPLHAWPIEIGDAVVDGIADIAVAHEHVSTEDARHFAPFCPRSRSNSSTTSRESSVGCTVTDPNDGK